jgi:hypothetical protein
VLEITDLRDYSHCTQVFGVSWVANQSDDIVAAIDEQTCEPDCDLPVRSRYCNSHWAYLTSALVRPPSA